MLYVQRNAEGKLERVEDGEFEGMTGTLPLEHPDIIAWATDSNLLQLEQSDLAMIRVLEDLISAMINKGIISITDLPPAARFKLLDRIHTRQALSSEPTLLDDEEEEGLI